jgi:hypothetical protein
MVSITQKPPPAKLSYFEKGAAPIKRKRQMAAPTLIWAQAQLQIGIARMQSDIQVTCGAPVACEMMLSASSEADCERE